MTVTRYDYIELKADVSQEGWIRDRPVVTRSGIFEYRTANGKVRREFRSDSEVFSTDSLNSLLGIPVTDNHRGVITKDNANGIIGTVLSPGVKSDSDVVAEIIIHDANKLGKRRELSLGYVCETKEVAGEYNGQRYDCEQVNIRYNHLAVVSKGRAGNAKLRLDSADDAVDNHFEIEKDHDMPDVKLVTIRLDEIDYQTAPEVSNALKKAKEDVISLQKRFDSLEAERDSFKSKLADSEKSILAAKATARSEIKARLELETMASNNSIKFDENDTDRSIREKILSKLNSSFKFDGKSDDYVNSAFDIAIAYETDKNKKVSKQKGTFERHDGKNSDDVPAAISAREMMLRKMRGEVEAAE